MKRNLNGTPSLVVLSLVLAASGAFAQLREGASVPFAFQVSGKQLPAGSYSVTKQIGTNIVTIQNREIGSSVMLLGTPQLSGNKSHKLVFHRIGGQYFLSQIWGAEGAVGMVVPVTRQEKRLEIARVTPEANNNVEIALK